MREIKFKIFDKKNKKMLEVDTLFINEGMFKPVGGDEYSVWNYGTEYFSKPLQNTGLKDKNDTEIYNNYVLQDDEGRLFQVIEDNRIGQTGYIISCVKNKSEEDHIKIGSIYDFWSWLYPDNYLEVIGNIYENFELSQGN